MKILATIIYLAFVIIPITLSMKAGNEFNNQIGYHWALADKSSTIKEKSRHIDNYVKQLEQSGLSGVNDALFFPTPNSDFDANLTALKSLQGRLHDISGMDENSFAYQTAMQQITAQEQGEASDMVQTFVGCWFKEHHYILWNPLITIIWATLSIGLIFILMFIYVEYD